MFKLADVAELAEEAALTDLDLEGAKPLKLRCVNVVSQRSGREVQMNRLALFDGALNLCHGA